MNEAVFLHDGIIVKCHRMWPVEFVTLYKNISLNLSKLRKQFFQSNKNGVHDELYEYISYVFPIWSIQTFEEIFYFELYIEYSIPLFLCM